MIQVRVARPGELAFAFAIRREVFVVEQGIAETLEFDGQDETCTHFLVFENDRAIATARLRPVGRDEGKVERVAVIEGARGRHVGSALMDAIEHHARETGFGRLTLAAQTRATSFYAARGYASEGDAFVEAGIAHQRMTRRL